ncbi:MAG: Rdx family protein [Proteobacteria bacterium]|nr:Rdx family protein [Pseudomonadota bacterium]
MEKRFDARVELVKGSGGIFDVFIDGARIFSKHDVGRFPEPGEIEKLIGRL